ncbi:transglycosylase SLT domain protein [Methylophaga frappieri]|uniref:Transglycosylase SLT domain protein n=1 Tax=Methylophaga frappieri (strain ATCC BAA-2434 / DSM 25690 / JAM7) TaxID=754477 RepID=I1YGF0_METFJ|nr:transglycosylase SLT domain-containing protein [Methylophaga frappieri]AFJ01993.1 transglycosylase SLT domain protein [Methylophaga frappieri]
MRIKFSLAYLPLILFSLVCLGFLLLSSCLPASASITDKSDHVVAFEPTFIAKTIGADRFEHAPVEARQYQRLLRRSAHAYWGLDAPIATMAGQVHQESRWQPDAKSPVGAEGLAQFMPTTSDWFSTLYPDALGDNQPFHPGWALRALVLYDHWLYQRVTAADNCQRWALTLSAYNGGLGWVYRDKQLASAKGADPLVWFNSIEHHSRRADWARRENRTYVRNILTRWELMYAAAGWGAGICH